MRALKGKLILKIFFLLLFLELLVGLLDAYLAYNNSGFETITSWLMLAFSLPISFISRDLPFYVTGDIIAAILYWLLNLLLQTAIVYSLIELYKKRKKI